MRVASARVMSEVVADPASLVGQCLAERYDLEQWVGRGATGATYRGKHVEQQRTVVVKVFGGDVRDDLLRQRRFELETSKLAGLSHPNAPAVLGFGVHHGLRFVVREWLEGETLAKRLEAGPLELEAAMSIARQLLAALAAGRGAKLLHRNLHPNNVFLESRTSGGERVKLLDFAPAPRTPIKSTSPFLPPELAAGELLDARSDVFAVGALVAAMVRPASVPPVRPSQPAVHPPSDAYGAQGLASAAVVAVLSTTAPGTAAATQPVAVTSFVSSSARDSAVSAEAVGAPESSASDDNDRISTDVDVSGRSAADTARPDLVSAFDEAFAPPVVAPAPAAGAASAEPETPLQRWIRRATAETRSERFDDAADMLRELVDRFPRDPRVARSEAPRQQPTLVPGPVAPTDESPEDVMAGSAARTAPLPVAKSLLPPPSPPGANPSATQLPEASPIALHSKVEPGTTQLTAATAVGAFAFAAVVMLVMPGELGRANRPVPAINAPAPVAIEPQVETPKTPEPLAPIPLSAIAAAPASAVVPPPPAATGTPLPTKPKVGKNAPARDPWHDPIPKDLQRLRARALSGSAGDKATLEALRLYNREHATDARGYLVTARFYLNRMWRTDGVGQYAAALERDPTVRGAPEMLPALLECVTEGKAAVPAETLIEKTWGNGAVPAIDQMLDRVKTQSAALRLSTLSEKLLARAP
ncbi:MAG TPA: protein kinase [Polyangiales bacterium]|nr:protein kinase [Polyangiales bacterium]